MNSAGSAVAVTGLASGTSAWMPWSERLFADGLERGHDCRVAVDDRGLVQGFSVVQYILDEAHLLNIAVDPDRQGKGIGRRLLTALMEEAVRKSSSTVFLECEPVLQMLFESAG